MNGYTDCSQAQRDQAKAVAKTYPTNFPTDLAAIVAAAKSDGYVHAAISGLGLVGAVALVKGTTRVRAGVIVKATKTRAYVLYYVQSSDRYFISTMDLAHLHVKVTDPAPKVEEAPATEEAPTVDLTPMDPANFRTGNLAEDVEAWLVSKGYGKSAKCVHCDSPAVSTRGEYGDKPGGKCKRHSVPMTDDDEEDEGCPGHESLDGAHMGESVYCDGSCQKYSQK